MNAERPQPETDKAISAGYGTPLERLLLGNNSIEGTARMLVYAGLFFLVFGSFFALVG